MGLRPTAVVIGVGQLGGCFAEGLARAGHPVVPLRRGDDPADAAAAVPEPALALVAVAEDDLEPALAALPPSWRSRTGLVQNELLPDQWREHGLVHPTVAVVWFERKGGNRPVPLLPTPVHGPGWNLVAEALDALSLPWRRLDDEAQLVHELVRKNLYVLTTNLVGLATGSATVGELWREHRALALQVASEILTLLGERAGAPADRVALLRGLDEAIDAAPGHAASGRSAPRRLARTLEHARRLGVEVPRLKEIAAAAPSGS